MIYLYSGTPGSGKSLHCASNIYNNLKYGNYVFISNFLIDFSCFKKDISDRYFYVDNKDLTPQFLIDFANKYWEEHPTNDVKKKEGHIKIYIDEAQMLFNSREWQSNYKKGWVEFFSIHRHLGFDVYFISQYDRMLDRQIRSLIEYEYIHRKVSNFGKFGAVVGFLFKGGIFCCVKVWYPLHEKVGSEFFTFKKKYDNLYDTFTLFKSVEVTPPVCADRG